MKIKSQKNFFSGVMFAVLGAAFAWDATTYTVGTGARTGPGYFPLMLGLLLTLIGLVVMFASLTVETEDGEKIGHWAWRPMVCILAANLAFCVLLVGLPGIGMPAMGMVAAIYALVIIASFADRGFGWRHALVLATVLAAGGYVTFVWALKLQIQMWPAFIAS